MTYFVQTAGGIFILDTGGLSSALQKENLTGKAFLAVKTAGGEKVFVNVAHIVSIQPAGVQAKTKEQA